MAVASYSTTPPHPHEFRVPQRSILVRSSGNLTVSHQKSAVQPRVQGPGYADIRNALHGVTPVQRLQSMQNSSSSPALARSLSFTSHEQGDGSFVASPLHNGGAGRPSSMRRHQQLANGTSPSTADRQLLNATPASFIYNGGYPKVDGSSSPSLPYRNGPNTVRPLSFGNGPKALEGGRKNPRGPYPNVPDGSHRPLPNQQLFHTMPLRVKRSEEGSITPRGRQVSYGTLPVPSENSRNGMSFSPMVPSRNLLYDGNGSEGPGTEVEIGDCRFRRLSVLGEGSFGLVWLCESTGGNTTGTSKVALKEVSCPTHPHLRQASAEYELLQAFEALISAPLRVPRCEAFGTYNLGDCYCLRMALTVCPGEPIIDFLKTGLTTGNGLKGNAFLRGARIAAKLMEDLVPTFKHISALAIHRDVNSHNILMSRNNGSEDEYSFWLIDFGLSVDATAWVQQRGPGSWAEMPVSGDCRYWPPAAWVMNLHGAEGLHKNSLLHRQYLRSLDIFGLGITAVELLCCVCLSSSIKPSELGPFGVCIHAMVSGWRNYFDDVEQWWSRLFNCVKLGQNIATVQMELRQRRVSDKLMQHLIKLRMVIRSVATRAEDPSVRVLLLTILEMLNEASEWGWDHIYVEKARWKSLSYASSREIRSPLQGNSYREPSKTVRVGVDSHMQLHSPGPLRRATSQYLLQSSRSGEAQMVPKPIVRDRLRARAKEDGTDVETCATQ